MDGIIGSVARNSMRSHNVDIQKSYDDLVPDKAYRSAERRLTGLRLIVSGSIFDLEA